MAVRCAHADLTTELRQRTEVVGAGRRSEWAGGNSVVQHAPSSWVLAPVLKCALDQGADLHTGNLCYSAIMRLATPQREPM